MAHALGVKRLDLYLQFDRPLEDSERTRFAQSLGPNRRVVVDHPMLDPIRAEIRSAVGAGDKAATARGIYDWVVDNVEYKKVGRGWGNGDTFRACNERYGNCTDFHALFISLARTEVVHLPVVEEPGWVGYRFGDQLGCEVGRTVRVVSEARAEHDGALGEA